MQRGVEERNFAERAGHLESLGGKKRKVTTIRTFGLSSSDCVGNIRPVQTHTHTPDVFLYAPPHAHTHMHTHTIARIGTDAEMLSCTHTHF